jgi:hypothetical protein
MQYYANVLLKYVPALHSSNADLVLTTYGRVNVKLGGVNTIPDTKSVPILTDSTNPTIVMGAL